jgi:hypothetical protein
MNDRINRPDFKLAAELALDLGPDRGRRLLEALASAAVLREFDRQCAVRHAHALLQQGRLRAEIVPRLMAAYRIGRSTAHRYVDVASDGSRPITPLCDGTHVRDDQAITTKEVNGATKATTRR